MSGTLMTHGLHCRSHWHEECTCKFIERSECPIDTGCSTRRFPMQRGPDIDWQTAEKIYEMYSALYGTSQSLERLAERHGFGWAEVEHIQKEYTAQYGR